MNSPTVIELNCSRENLFIQINQKSDKPFQQIVDFIKSNYLGKRGIVYCPKRKDTVDLAHYLKSNDIVCFCAWWFVRSR